VLRFLVFLGSVRESVPPRPARLGLRVTRACVAALLRDGREAELVDPLDFDLGGVFKPQFAYPAGRAPAVIDALASRISAADGYVMVSPEYNHSMSPALMHLLNHFGASRFALKPSVIVTYSAGQWGGARAAVNMRTFLAELGCLPVSAMVHVPKAQEALTEDGTWAEGADAAAWDRYLGRALGQLVWWAEAAAARRAQGLPPGSPAFDRDPAQRNAP
jgi:NAD(P)H-dependent FMN reductase